MYDSNLFFLIIHYLSLKDLLMKDDY